jgi:rare lipoprotein A (peptidoglycan hydrolase)
MQKPRSLVIAPPAARRLGGLWVAGLGFFAYLVIAAWSGLGFQGLDMNRPARAGSAFATPAEALGSVLRGQATWYGWELQGNPTASGEPFDMNGLTAAHRTLPLGSRARVTNLRNGESVVVRINDRGPGRPGVLIDLSYRAAQSIGLKGSGPVEVAPFR